MGAEERRARGAMARITEGGRRGGGERKKNWIGGAYKRERDPSLNRLHPPPFLPHAGVTQDFLRSTMHHLSLPPFQPITRQSRQNRSTGRK